MKGTLIPYVLQTTFRALILPICKLTSKFNKGIRFYCVIEILTKYAWVIPLKFKKSIKITNPLGESNRKPNKRWLDKVS